MCSDDSIYICDILDFLGPNWVYEDAFRHFRYIPEDGNGVGEITSANFTATRANFTARFTGYTCDMYLCGGGVGWIFVPNKIRRIR